MKGLGLTPPPVQSKIHIQLLIPSNLTTNNLLLTGRPVNNIKWLINTFCLSIRYYLLSSINKARENVFQIVTDIQKKIPVYLLKKIHM